MPRLDIDGEWQRLSPKYLGLEIASVTLFGVIAIGATLTFSLTGWFAQPFGWIAVGVAVAITVVMFFVAPRRVRSYGYQLRADDLLFRRGIMFHRVVSVPYGRMQLIDINRGPVARLLGLAELRFVTAAAATGVTLPGLADADADALRDTLVGLAETRRAGL
ncbi:PH domain-containing protein [Agreia sp. COWG]|uniref:PH domain-containing protein n=1 Tax=Agreia sp. COWG TaxID=2773266 RepID=UPI0019288902|nr:PH domain-containing protein [Agreia sp. COWG]CAD6006036.1 transmembrane protein, distant homology with ydbS [Agreia sp. COWG]